jgi:hypothetical protein
MSSQVRDFLKEILTIEEGYSSLIEELCRSMDCVFGEHCFLSPVVGIQRLRDAALKGIRSGDKQPPTAAARH